MNTKVRQKARNNFEKYFSKLMSNAGFGKTIENVRKHRNIKLLTAKTKGNHLLSEPYYHTTNFFYKLENLAATEIKKTLILMNEPVYLSSLILDLSKIVMCELWYHYLKQKYGENAKP